MVDNADTSSGTKCDSEAEALAPASSSTRNATNQAGFEIEAASKATSLSAQPIRHMEAANVGFSHQLQCRGKINRKDAEVEATNRSC